MTDATGRGKCTTRSQASTFLAPGAKKATSMENAIKKERPIRDWDPTGALTTLETDEYGRLHIVLNPLRREDAQWIADSALNDACGLLEIIDEHLNDSLFVVLPEYIGALTDSIILADSYIDRDSEAADFATTTIWWYPQYAVESYTDTLLEKGEIVFTLAANY